ncbi:Outer membrane protein beta-barrel domain-containing protein [Pseudarcicella hirudinis]|uniref:Outer membrane protein beta-barrel domain-containing protein n=1 Tax=Pseudarcicella hirudinis TaxID=1079859 RepID=A0A1I5YLA9_9BACT|nr:porin family protein [Pseudarcicella hirudinis]SFQ44677.1 Outer membrane protein beta-barrel domain-containing protein [Pseudarcicella hirudinis]
MLTTYFWNQHNLYWQKITNNPVKFPLHKRREFLPVTPKRCIQYTSFLLFFLSFGFLPKAQAQHSKYVRIYDEFYDDKKVHFGFLFGFASSRFNVYRNDKYLSDTTQNIVSPESFAFQVGGIINIKLNERFDFKTGLNIALYSRQVDYSFPNIPQPITEIRESTWLEVPLLLKFKSQRRGNTRMFVDAGIKLGIEANVRKNATIARLNTSTNDLSLEYGIGLERFFQFFKFTPELRFSHGLTNIFLPPANSSQSALSRDIDRLQTHNVTLYLMFE